MSRRTQHLGSLAAVLLLFAACLGSRERGEGCACRPERLPGSTLNGSTANDSTPAVTSATVPPAPPESLTSEPVSAAGPAPDFADPSWTRVPSRAGSYLVCWRTVTGKVPRNEDFELEVWVLRDGASVPGVELTVNGWMPDHGHGMLRQPRSARRADGSFRVEGMLLHMRGLWQLRFDVLEGALSEAAECALEL
ncbi:MAG: hypothetical protein HOP15_15440 [Planctomycetes bacterium]|nr:hypothetical protein [Planctomycetota bacterium]